MTVFLFASCCEDGSRYPHREQKTIDIVGTWRLTAQKVDIKISFDGDGGFTSYSLGPDNERELLMEGTYKLRSESGDKEYLLEWDGFDHLENKPGKEHWFLYLQPDGVLRAEDRAKIRPMRFIRDFY